jgi:hypothetical protein
MLLTNALSMDDVVELLNVVAAVAVVVGMDATHEWIP